METAVKKTHGLKNHKLYKTWIDIKTRVFNIKCKSYEQYGGRGITICERWLDVKNFIDDMYPSYKEGLSIDRINNDGNYEPSNCRWATKSEQSQNTRRIHSTNTSGYRGVSFRKDRNAWHSQIKVNNKTIHIGLYNTAEDAGYAYDKYVIDNNLEHTTNGLYQRGIKW